MQIMDPFDFGGCCRKDPKYDFWNHPQPEPEGDDGNVEANAANVKSESVATEAEDGAVASPGAQVKKRSL